LPLAVQAKLLRTLQNGEIQRVGSDDTIVVDVRIVAATNRNLQLEVKEGRFRADLYHRLSVYPLPVPPLRDRGKDVILLAGYFLEKNQHQLGVTKLRLQQTAIDQLTQYHWPGNVRELEHVLSRAALRATSEQGRHASIISISRVHLGSEFSPSHSAASAIAEVDNISDNHSTIELSQVLTLGLRDSTDEYQRQVIQTVLAAERGNLAAVARCLKLDRSNLIRTMQRLGLDPNAAY
jgi:anaerobic nitric oxide reductase transcription regulator